MFTIAPFYMVGVCNQSFKAVLPYNLLWNVWWWKFNETAWELKTHLAYINTLVYSWQSWISSRLNKFVNIKTWKGTKIWYFCHFLVWYAKNMLWYWKETMFYFLNIKVGLYVSRDSKEWDLKRCWLSYTKKTGPWNGHSLMIFPSWKPEGISKNGNNTICLT